jgi:hypothetical protein
VHEKYIKTANVITIKHIRMVNPVNIRNTLDITALDVFKNGLRV